MRVGNGQTACLRASGWGPVLSLRWNSSRQRIRLSREQFTLLQVIRMLIDPTNLYQYSAASPSRAETSIRLPFLHVPSWRRLRFLPAPRRRLTRATFDHVGIRLRTAIAASYSVRRTRMGSTEAARLAGRKQARIAAASKTTATDRKAVKSRAGTSNNMLRMARPTK